MRNIKQIKHDYWAMDNSLYIFMSIFCTAHPNRFQESLKYMSDVRFGAKRNPGLDWFILTEPDL
jgi:hypothetical protein